MHGSNKVAPGAVAAHQYSEQPRFSMPLRAQKSRKKKIRIERAHSKRKQKKNLKRR
jgi:hypothetical protein